MDGFLSSMQLVRAHDVDLLQLGDQAALRAYRYLVAHNYQSISDPYGVTNYFAYFFNYLYGTSFPVRAEKWPYSHLAYGSWLFVR
jgi:hypothetical protein